MDLEKYKTLVKPCRLCHEIPYIGHVTALSLGVECRTCGIRVEKSILEITPPEDDESLMKKTVAIWNQIVGDASRADSSLSYRPVIVVEDSNKKEFEQHCAVLVRDGYRLQSASCGHADATYDFCNIYQAIYVAKIEG